MTRNRTLRRPALLAFVIGLLVLLSGCVKVDASFQVHDDDTVSGTLLFAYSDEVVEALDTPIDELIPEDDGPFDQVDGSTSEPYSEDGYTGRTYTFTNAPLSEFNENDDGSGDQLTITRNDDGGYTLAGRLDLSEAELGDFDGLADVDTSGASIRFTIEFPGSVTSENGDVDGNTVTFDVPLGEATTFDARSEPASALPGGTLLWVVIGIVVLLAVAGVLLLVLRRRRTPAAAGGYPGGPGQAWGQPQGQPYGAPQGQQPYQGGQPSTGQAPYGQPSTGQAPYGQPSTGQQPYQGGQYGQQPYQGGQPAQGQQPYQGGQQGPGPQPYQGGQPYPGQQPPGSPYGGGQQGPPPQDPWNR